MAVAIASSRARPALEKRERQLADEQDDGDQDRREIALVDAIEQP